MNSFWRFWPLFCVAFDVHAGGVGTGSRGSNAPVICPAFWPPIQDFDFATSAILNIHPLG